MSDTNNTPVKIYKLNDYEWAVGHTLEETIAAYIEQTRINPAEADVAEAREVTDEEMNTLTFWTTDDCNPGDPRHWLCRCGYIHSGASRVNRWTGTQWEHLHNGDEGYTPMKNIHLISFTEALCLHIKDRHPIPGHFATIEI
jgi:hypothetical protein